MLIINISLNLYKKTTIRGPGRVLRCSRAGPGRAAGLTGRGPGRAGPLEPRLKDCSFTRQIWALSNIPFIHWGLPIDSVEEWVRILYAKLERSTWEFAMVLLWSIWYNRNQLVFEDVHGAPLELVEFARRYASQSAELLRQQIKPPVGRYGEGSRIQEQQAVVRPAAGAGSGNRAAGWEFSGTKLPGENTVRMNVDAAFSDDGSRVGIGFGVWMHDGLFARRWDVVKQHVTPQCAEAFAIRAAVHWGVLQGYRRIQLFTDCLSLVKLFVSRSFEFSIVGPILTDVSSLASSLESFTLDYVPREENLLAHKLARRAVR